MTKATTRGLISLGTILFILIICVTVISVLICRHCKKEKNYSTNGNKKGTENKSETRDQSEPDKED